MNSETNDASKRARYAVDRAVRYLITAGGLGVIASILLILLFLFKETVPLWLPSRIEPKETVPAAHSAALLVGISDDVDLRTKSYEGIGYLFDGTGALTFHALPEGTVIDRVALSELAGEAVTAVDQTVSGLFAFGTEDGAVLTGRVSFRVEEGAERRFHPSVLDRRLWDDVTNDPPIRALAYRQEGVNTTLAVLDGSGRIHLVAEREGGGFLGEEVETRRITIEPLRSPYVTLTLDSTGESLYAATKSGELVRLRVSDASDGVPTPIPHVAPLSSRPTTMRLLLGDSTLLVGDATGTISTYFDALQPDGSRRFVHVRDFRAHRGSVTAIVSSTRKKLFLSAGADGVLAVHHFTSGRTVARRQAGQGPIDALGFSPRGDRALALVDGRLATFAIDTRHVEASMKTLFGKVWYENSPKPEYVWQSSAGSAASEPKLSLIPLIFGTIKGTFYALLFAVPLSVLAALYTSQFMPDRLRAVVKPAIELMGALPSVVVGFLAGLWLAPLLERSLVPLFLVPIIAVPLLGLAAYLVYRTPTRFQRRLPVGIELAAALPLLLIGFWLSGVLGSAVERAVFGGDFRLWVRDVLGLAFDQRNAVVVGIAMGFAVIPLIFTMTEDAMSRVPRPLRTASLALGATEWQTAWRVILPAATPGIFSAVMIGFGRAIGETMIVLMATGNTPLMEWNPFTGMRTLSANIAVELPEAPVGGTLYRVLFLTAVILFIGTFGVNTLAEIVRGRLSRRFGSA